MTRKRSMKTPLSLERVSELDRAKYVLHRIRSDNDFRGAASRDAELALRAINRIFGYDDVARKAEPYERLS